MPKLTPIHPNLTLELCFKGDANFTVSWIIEGKYIDLKFGFAHKGEQYVRNDYKAIDCEAQLKKSEVNGVKLSKFEIKGVKKGASIFSSSALKYTVPQVVKEENGIYEYSIPIKGLPYAKQENKLETLTIELPHGIFQTSSLLAARPFPDSMLEINEKRRLIYKSESLEQTDQSIHLKFEKAWRQTTWYLVLIGIISGIISGSVVWLLQIVPQLF